MRTRKLGALGFTILTAGALIACGTVYADPITVPYTFGSSSTFDSGPITLPKTPAKACVGYIDEDSPCDNLDQSCEVGTSSDPDCNATFTCIRDAYAGQYWTETTPRSCPDQCPAPSAIVDGAPCTLPSYGANVPPVAEMECRGPTSLCACTTGPDGAHVHDRKWVCVTAGDGCPLTRPLNGQSCLGDHTCDYGGCAFKRGTGMICQDGVWQIQETACPR
jgi:hypothetical protein